MSFGIVVTDATRALRSTAMDADTHNSTSPAVAASRAMLLATLLSVSALAVQFVAGVSLIPARVLTNFDSYGQSSVAVLSAMGVHLRDNTFLALVAWLAPIGPATMLPLNWAGVPLGVLAFVASAVIWGSFLSPGEPGRFAHMMQHTPEFGYMWFEVVTIGLTTLFVTPQAFVLAWSGPIACVCLGETQTRSDPLVFVGIAIASVLAVLPTVSRLVNDDGTFFLHGYTTSSFAGTVLQMGFMLVWIRAYHVVCRDCALTFRQSSRATDRIAAVTWLLVGTALVEVWACSAWALHFAYTSWMRLDTEPSVPEFVLKAWRSRRGADSAQPSPRHDT